MPRLGFGPGFAYVFTVGFLFFLSALLLSWISRLPASQILMALGLGLVGVFVLVSGWERYRLDREGLLRRTAFRRDLWRWEQLGSVRGTVVGRIAGDALEVGIDAARQTLGTLHGSSRLTRYEIADANGRVVFRIGPWVRGRQRLAAEIRRRAAAARRR